MIRVIIIEDQSLLRDSLRIFLNSREMFSVVAESPNAVDAYDLYAEHRPDLILMDIYTANGNGITETMRIKRDFPEACIYMLTGIRDDSLIKLSKEAGADGYLCKDISGNDLENIIQSCKSRYSIFPIESMDDSVRSFSCSDFEADILQLLSLGLSVEEIGEKLNYSPYSIKTYINRILKKNNLKNRAQLLSIATKFGYVDPENNG